VKERKFFSLLKMREIVHLQAGQCGNQIGAKVSEISRPFPTSLSASLHIFSGVFSSVKVDLIAASSERKIDCEIEFGDVNESKGRRAAICLGSAFSLFLDSSPDKAARKKKS
jgi:hypothetical protein